MRHSMVWAVVFIAAFPVRVRGQLDEDGSHATIRGQTFTVYPADKLRARGLDVPEIPRERNAAWVYVDAMNALLDPPQDIDREVFDAAVAGTWPEGESGSKLSAWLKQNTQAIELSRRAASMPEYNMPLFRGDSDALIMALLPHLGSQRQLAKLLSVEAARQKAEGRSESAIEDYLTVQRMGHQVGRGNTLIEGLVGIAVSGLAERGFMQVAESGEVDGAVLRAAGEELDRLAESFPNWEDMVRAEQRWASSAIDDMMDMPGTVGALATGMPGMSPASGKRTGWTRLVARLKRLYLPDRVMKKHMRSHYEALIAESRHEDGSVGIDLEAEAALMKRLPVWDVASRMLLPSLSRSHELTLRARSNLVRARTALAVAAYRKDHGRNPPALSALTPRYMSEVPIDPMTGHLLEAEAVDPSSQATGVSLVTRETENKLIEERKRPPTGQLRASRWRRFTNSFAARHKLTDAQLASAEAIVRDIEERAARFEASQRAAIERMSSAREFQRLSRTLAPLDGLFEELKNRLAEIPTAEQKAAAGKRPDRSE